MFRPGCGWVLLLSNVKQSLLKNCSRKVTFIFILVLQSLAVLHHGEGSSSLMLQLYETLQCQCVHVVLCLICGSSLFVTFSELHVPLLAVQNTDELLDVKLQAQYIFLQLNCCCCKLYISAAAHVAAFPKKSKLLSKPKRFFFVASN